MLPILPAPGSKMITRVTGQNEALKLQNMAMLVGNGFSYQTTELSLSQTGTIADMKAIKALK